MARREFHFVEFAHIPGAEYEPTRIGITPNLFDERCELVDLDGLGRFGPGRWSSAPATPLCTVDGPEFAGLIGPLVPDRDAVGLKRSGVRVASNEPEQLVNDGLQVQLLGGDQRKSLPQVETHLIAERTQCPGAGTVELSGSTGEDVID